MLLKVICTALLLAASPISSAIGAKPPVQQEQQAPGTPAADQKPTQPTAPMHADEEHPTPPSYEGAFIKMLLTLGGLVLAIFLTIWLLRKLGQGRLRGSSGERSIQIVERRPLSPKSMLYLVEIGEKRVLIAESQVEVRCLSDWDELEEEEE